METSEGLGPLRSKSGTIFPSFPFFFSVSCSFVFCSWHSHLYFSSICVFLGPLLTLFLFVRIWFPCLFFYLFERWTVQLQNCWSIDHLHALFNVKKSPHWYETVSPNDKSTHQSSLIATLSECSVSGFSLLPGSEVSFVLTTSFWKHCKKKGKPLDLTIMVKITCQISFSSTKK